MAETVDIRDLIADRIMRLQAAVEHLQALVQRHDDLPGRDAALRFVDAHYSAVTALGEFFRANATPEERAAFDAATERPGATVQ